MSIKKACVAMAVISMIISGCPKSTLVSPMPPIVTDQDMCQAACDHIGPKGLNCEEGKPIVSHVTCTQPAECAANEYCEGGFCKVSCTQFCIETENQGVWLDPVCVAKVAKCSDIDSCPMASPKK